MSKDIDGFSKFSKEEKIRWISQSYFSDPEEAEKLISSYNHSDSKIQKKHDEFIENSLGNFYFPIGVAPNFLINNKTFTLPMAIEESSVVAAACKAAKFWAHRGGFKATILGQEKIGQVHFLFQGSFERLNSLFQEKKVELIKDLENLTQSMEKRGGGILDIELVDKTELIDHYFQLHLTFDTVDSMGANFINSCLEQIASVFKNVLENHTEFTVEERVIEIVMSILSNYVPNCLVKAEVRCPIEKLGEQEGISAKHFVQKFIQAVEIAKKEPYRAVTHNKGIMNGVDALVIATGNDFRAVEAGVHAFAAREGSYSSLSNAYVMEDDFVFELTLPLSLGTIGGLTQLHPMVKWSMELLGNPNAKELMQIVAVAGLAQNFAALRSLVTSGIQKGHMKMHLLNILNQNNASEAQKIKAVDFFKTNTVTHSAVSEFLNINP